MYQDLHFYIDLDWVKHISEDNYLKKIYSLIDFVHKHKAKIFYSHTQLIEFTKNCNDLDENFSTSIGNQLDVIINTVGATPIKKQDYIFEVCFADKNTSLNHVNDFILSSVIPHSKQAILLSTHNKSPLLMVTPNGDFHKIELSYLEKVEDIQHWIVENSTKRNFNLSPKHGENGKGNWKGESVLLCNEKEANELLKSAIPDFFIHDNRLFNWDENCNTYIEFFYEGENPQNQWHGFHLDLKDWNRVPTSIRKFFNK